LSEAKEEIFKSLTLNISVQNINKEFTDELALKIEQNKGKVALNIKLYNKEEKIWIEMFSRKHFININEQFIDFLKKNPNIEYKIN
jgi:DNA polymerase-3 subunit alpha